MVICFRARTVSLHTSHFQPFFLSSLSGAVKRRSESSIESVASVMSSDRSRKRSNEKELAPHSLLVQVHCETVRPPKTRLGEAVRSAFGGGEKPSSGPRRRRLSACSFNSSSSMSLSKLRRNSWASSCIPKVNSPKRGSHRATSVGPTGTRQRRARFCGRTAFLPDWPERRTLHLASSAGTPSSGMPAMMTPSSPFRSLRSRPHKTTRSPGLKPSMAGCPLATAGDWGRGSMQLLATLSRSHLKQLFGAQPLLPVPRPPWWSWQTASNGGAAW
mmetsp:Transcript_88901/g.246979  ORF Transcript_88901/g.246979 Transcript_88901/m.246979 type:complete len:273 (-) Transcript_88901:44-862(-)